MEPIFSVGLSWQPSNEDTAEIVLTEGYHDINIEYLVRGSNSYIYLEELENDTYTPFAHRYILLSTFEHSKCLRK